MPVGVKLASVHEAVRHGDVLELEAMVKRGASINEVENTKDKFTPIHWACHAGSLECLHWLLWHGGDVNVTTPQGWTPSHIAAIRGQEPCIQALSANGGNMSCTDRRGSTPAHLASAHGNSYTLNTILRAGTDLDAKDLNGWTAVHVACYHGRLGCLQLLVKWGARTDEVDNNGNTPAHLAATEGHLPCFKFLVSSGSSISQTLGARNDNGETPKTLAQQFYKQACVDYINAVEWERDHPEDQENLAFPAHMAAAQGDVSHLRMLIEQGVVNINERDDKGSTPAHRAAGNGHLQCLQWLVEMGANVHIQNSGGETPADVASRFAQLACVKLLKGDGSDSDEDPGAADGDDADDGGEEKLARRAADHGNEGSSMKLSKAKKQEGRGRALKRIEELERLLVIAKKNYNQLGGQLEEDRELLLREKETERTIKELESQLEYERLRREKLESKLDECRAEIQHLNAQLEKSSGVVSEEEVKPKKKNKKKTRPSSAATGGVFVKRNVSKPPPMRNLDLF
ncbi:ankyrin repeat domain-containing protein 42-like isoform X2 [Anneissia japonica]|uniref:ankyrin repeat domain-containing protein 42-like isoform X2 n=1 Tax=Anneissia japonica TaxID=1529436 RepID=UPI00142566DD|nr:ankyrin repeat domain-containing protein 42-like isoform X2 [Anneissia japonica]